MSLRVRIASVGLLALFQAAMAGCAADVGQTSQGIFGGVNDTVHTNVLGIVIQTSMGLGECTGSLIAPNLVLTARHCVSDTSSEAIVCSTFTQNGMTYTPTTAGPPFNPGSFLVTTDPVISQRSPFTRVAEVWVPDNTTNQPMCGKDIALLRLTSNITSVPLIEPRVDIAARVGEIFTASGYGATNSRGAGSGTRRMRDGLRVEHVGLAQARPGLTVVAEQELLADTGTCQGDSGGPALDEIGAVFGILSRGDATSCASPIYTRVDSYGAWIRERTRAAATSGGYPLPSWVEPPVSRPGTFGDECRTDDQCDIPLQCLPVGAARRCTSNDCMQCPSGWVCNADGNRCIPDPNVTPPPPADSGVPAADGGDPAADGGTPPAQMSGGCSVRGPQSQRGSNGIAVGALALAATLVTAARRRAKR
ncbi:MAG: S1 family peptidase [Polyangiales bacterium]